MDDDTLDYETLLTRFAMGDEAFISSIVESCATNVASFGLDVKSSALVRIGALLALDGAPPSYAAAVALATASGATIDEIVGVLLAVAQTIGVARTVSAAPELALAIGFDIDVALERPTD